MADWHVTELLPQPLATPMVPERGGYTLTMRECRGTDAVLAMLAHTRCTNSSGPRVHMGWGSFRNLDIMAARRSDAAVLLDVNAHQFRVWEAVEASLRHPEARTPEALVELLLARLPTHPPLRQFASSTRTWLMSDLGRPSSWLYAPEPSGFEWVRECVRAGQVAVACLDMRGGRSGAARFQDLSRRLRQGAEVHGVRADTLYVSNLPWMMGLPRGFFGERHADHASTATAAGVLSDVRRHLTLVAPSFSWVISAAHLCADATADNLQWATQALSPTTFLADAHWHGVTDSIARLGLSPS